MIEIRRARLPQDAPRIAALDRSFRTETILAASETPRGLELHLIPKVVTKEFPLEDLEGPDRPWDAAWVATQDEAVVGFAATAFQPWNRRLVLWHFYVDANARRNGIGRRLFDVVRGEAEECGAAHIWLETSNQNVPGMAAYRALGLRCSGVDLTLYDATPAQGEFAIFFSCPVKGLP